MAGGANGTDGYGGGGGGGYCGGFSAGFHAGGNGGKGIVVIRYCSN